MKKIAFTLALLVLPLLSQAQTRTDLKNIYNDLQKEDLKFFRSHNASHYLIPDVLDYSIQPGNSGYNNTSSNNSSSNSYNSSGTSNSNKGTLVGHIQAFGLSNSYGSTTPHHQSIAVYSDGGRYYILVYPLNVPSYLQTNTRGKYMDYDVSRYRYWVLDTGSDITWFLNL